jgi:hypothetical protein
MLFGFVVFLISLSVVLFLMYFLNIIF